MMQVSPTHSVVKFVTPFGGGGGGGKGGQAGFASFRGSTASTVLLGGFDHDPYANRCFKYLTGVNQVQMDALLMTPEQVHEAWGHEAPDVVLSSPPCVGATTLISNEKASTPFYVEKNSLMLVSTTIILKAYKDAPGGLPAWFIFENVPGLASDSRGGKMLKKLVALLKAHGYAVHIGHHNARHVGGGAQNRVRLLVVARLIAKVPVFLYKPPKLNGLVIADVLGPLPLPDDPAGGPMHHTSRKMSFRNRLRLWAIPAGEDWRALRKEKASPRSVELLPQGGAPGMHEHKYAVQRWDAAARCVCTATRIGSGAPSVAQPIDLTKVDSAFHHGAGPGRLGVLNMAGEASTVTSNARPTTGPFSVAAPVPVALEPTGTPFHDAYGVKAGDQAADAVKGESAPSNGGGAWAAPVPVDLLPRVACFDKGYGVLRPDEPARTIASTSSVGCGAYAMAAAVPVELALGCTPHAGSYGVQAFGAHAKTVIAHHKVDAAPGAVADPRPAPRYVVLGYEQVRAIVAGEIPLPFAIVDPARPDEPLAIVDDLDAPAYRMVRVVGKRGRVTEKRENVTVVMIAADGTWHRELTTLELAVLQDLPWMLHGKPLDFGGTTTEQRKVIGNMIPAKVMEVVFGQILISTLASKQGFFLSPSNWDVWVQGLRDEGYEVIDAGRGPVHLGHGVMLDDGAVRPEAQPKRRTVVRPGARPEHAAHVMQ